MLLAHWRTGALAHGCASLKKCNGSIGFLATLLVVFSVVPGIAFAQYECKFLSGGNFNVVAGSPAVAFEMYRQREGLPTHSSTQCKGAPAFGDEALGPISYEDANQVRYTIWETLTKDVCVWDDATQKSTQVGSQTVTRLLPIGGEADDSTEPPTLVQFVCTKPIQVQAQIQLTGPSQTRPTSTGGSAIVDLVAKVTSDNQPKPGVTVNFTVEVTPNSGGHEHHDASRPKGSISKVQGITDANGEVKLIFTVSQMAGIHTVKASCEGCTNSPAAKEVQVKVPDLLNIFTMPYRSAQWAYPGIGITSEHSDQHYLTVAAATRMLDISQKFQKIWPNASKLTLNDASLVWGGKLDIPGTWERNPRAHAEHRIGENIDVRANSAPGAVPSNIRDVVFRWLRKTSRPEDRIPPEFVIESVNPLWENPGFVNEHFHLRLGN